jgi:hypothetical protein
MENDRLTSARIDLLYDYSKTAVLSMHFDFPLSWDEIKVEFQNLVVNQKRYCGG